MSTPPPEFILRVEDLKMYFPIYGGIFKRQIGEVKALDGVSLSLAQGETLGLVGESGCGKTTMGRAIIRLTVPTAGKILFRRAGGGGAAAGAAGAAGGAGGAWSNAGEVIDLAPMSRSALRPIRSEIQMIFQDPFSSLNPRLTVGEIVEEPLTVHSPLMSRTDRQSRVMELLTKVGLSREQAFRYPHEFSGGQRQRIGIARALSTHPRLIIADEPVSALDVSIQAQVINLMQDLQEEFGLTYIFVAHDLAVVEHISTRIAVMYLGNVVETAVSADLYGDGRHPYTKALLSAIPVADPRARRPGRIVLTGDVPSPVNKPSGCGFRTRCPIAKPECAKDVPVLREVAPGHHVACPYA